MIEFHCHNKNKTSLSATHSLQTVGSKSRLLVTCEMNHSGKQHYFSHLTHTPFTPPFISLPHPFHVPLTPLSYPFHAPFHVPFTPFISLPHPFRIPSTPLPYPFHAPFIPVCDVIAPFAFFVFFSHMNILQFVIFILDSVFIFKLQ